MGQYLGAVELAMAIVAREHSGGRCHGRAAALTGARLAAAILAAVEAT